MAHYAQVTEADMKEAAKKAVMNEAENAIEEEVQNMVHPTAEPTRTESHDLPEETEVIPCDCDNKQQFATTCESVQTPQSWPRWDSNPYAPRGRGF